MDKFDDIRTQMLNYQSPLQLDQEWEALVLKQKNLGLQHQLQKRKMYFIGTGALVLLLSSLLLLMHLREDAVVLKEGTSLEGTSMTSMETDGQQLDQVESTMTLAPTHQKPEPASDKQKMLNPTELSKDFEESLEIGKFSQKERKRQKTKVSEIEANLKTLSIPDETGQKDKGEDFVRSEAVASALSQGEIPELSSLALQLPTPLMLPIDVPGIISVKEQVKIIEQDSTRKNFVSLELLGQGGFYSLNYGRILRENSWGDIRIQVGLSVNPQRFRGNLTGQYPYLIPVAISQSIKIRPSHRLVLGAGPTLVNDRIDGETSNDFYLIGNLKLGYRYERPGGRFFFKAEALYVQIYDQVFMQGSERFTSSESATWGGIGIGYKF